jgi:WD40 repeat protein
MGAAHFDVFLCHNGLDKPAVELIARKLKRAGLQPWFDKWCLTPGGNWQAELAAGLAASAACAVCVGPSGVGDWEALELQLANDRMAKDRSFRHFLVLLPGIPEPFDTTTLPPFLSLRTWVDLRTDIEDDRAFQRLIHAIKGIAPGAEAAAFVEARDDVCPYQGLIPFDEEHAEFFFGRDAELQRLIEKLKSTRFLAVLGPSGSGKSSLVRAGLIPSLRKGALAYSNTWPICLLTPTAHPLTALTAHLMRLYPHGAMQETLDRVSEDPRTLHLAVSLALLDRPSTDNVVWVVDQFEEIFTLCQDLRIRGQFLANLLYAASIPAGRNIVILTLRADFYAKCAFFPELSSRLASHQFLVTPMAEDNLRQAIEHPARRVGLQLESKLTETILHDVANQPGTLPLLEHALLELWKCRRGHMLTLEGYQERGGVRGAIAKRAEETYEKLNTDERVIVRRIMLRLTQPGEGTEDTRRRATMTELSMKPHENEAVERVISAMTEARLLTVSGDDATNERFVEVSHEALIRGWPTLRQWIEEDRVGIRIHRRLTEAAQEWERSSHDESLLYQGTKLAQAREWRDRHQTELNQLEQDFLDMSMTLQVREEEEAKARDSRELEAAKRLADTERHRAEVAEALARSEQRARVRQRRFMFGFLFLVLIAMTTAALAVRLEKMSRSRELAAIATSKLPSDPELSLLLAREAIVVSATAEAEEALRRSLLESHVRARFKGHSKALSEADFSPNGEYVVTASQDNSARIWDARTGRSRAELKGHTGPVFSAAFSPDSKFILTGSQDATARTWDANTGQYLIEFKGHQGPVFIAIFSPNGRLILTASEDGTARIWDTGTGRELFQLKDHGRPLTSATFSPDGKLVLTAGEDSTARIWDADTGHSLKELTGHRDFVFHAIFSPDGKLAATASRDGTARVWDIGTGRKMIELTGHKGAVSSVGFSADGNFIVTSSRDATARIWKVPTGDYVAELKAHTSPISSAQFSSDSKLLVTADLNGVGRLWDTSTWRNLAELKGHTAPISTVSFSPDSKLVLTASLDSTACLWDATVGQSIGDLKGHSGPVFGAAFSPDSKLVITASRDGTSRIWDTPTGRSVAELVSHRGPVVSATFNIDGKLALTASEDTTARVWDAGTGHALTELKGHTGSVMSATFSPDSKLVATGSEDNTARIWRISNGPSSIELKGHNGPVFSITMSPDGAVVVTTSWDTTARIWDLSTGKSLHELKGHTGPVSSAAFSPDGKTIATIGLDGTPRVWETATGKLLVELHGHTAPVFSVAFSPDGRVIATAGQDRTARLWETKSGRIVATLDGHNARVSSVAFHPERNFVVTASDDRTARIWEVGTARLLMELRGHNGSIFDARFSHNGQFIVTASEDNVARIYACEVCGSVKDLLDLSQRRVTRRLTEEERQKYLPPLRYINKLIDRELF